MIVAQDINIGDLIVFVIIALLFIFSSLQKIFQKFREAAKKQRERQRSDDVQSAPDYYAEDSEEAAVEDAVLEEPAPRSPASILKSILLGEMPDATDIEYEEPPRPQPGRGEVVYEAPPGPSSAPPPLPTPYTGSQAGRLRQTVSHMEQSLEEPLQAPVNDVLSQIRSQTSKQKMGPVPDEGRRSGKISISWTPEGARQAFLAHEIFGAPRAMRPFSRSQRARP